MFNDRAAIYWATFCLLVFFGTVIYAGLTLYKSAEETAYQSCILSFKNALIQTLKDDASVGAAIEIKQAWKTLSESEAERLFNFAGDTKSFDCKNYPAAKTGEGVTVSIRQIDGTIEMELQINGRIEPSL